MTRRNNAIDHGERTVADHVYFASTRSLCSRCLEPVEAKVIFRRDQVILTKHCPEHGVEEALLASSVDWYLDALSFLAPHTPPARTAHPTHRGCPFDCGPCPSHRRRSALPVIPITSACNLNCPVCYTINRNRDAYHLEVEEMDRILDRIFEEDPDCDIINFTGGEPTLHPNLPQILELCRRRGIRRLTVSTNGLRLRDEDYLRELAALDARIILSLDSFRPDTDRALLGRDTVADKQEVLRLLARHDVCTTILPVIARGHNDDEVGAILDLVLRTPHIVSLELHPMAFTGQGGAAFSREARITVPDLHRRIETATAGAITPKDFVPSPLAHPHCYSICYLLLLDDGGYVPFARLTSREKLYDLLQDSLYIEPRERLETAFREMIDDLWSNPERVPRTGEVLRTLKRLLQTMFPSDGPPLDIDTRRRIAERSAKAIYIHSHMDEETFDVSRATSCCVGVPEADGTWIPTCSYNVLYRRRDPRFAAPAAMPARTREAGPE